MTAKERYLKLTNKRDPFLQRAREAATLTIPALMPPHGATGHTKLPTPFQGLGARGLNNLASKLLLALMPPSEPFFRLTIDDYMLEQMTQSEGMRGEVEEALSKIERATQAEIETSAVRVTVAETLKQLIGCGNALLFLPYDGNAKMFKLDRYVASRDPMGNLMELVIEESVHPSMLPETLQQTAATATKNADDSINIYTHVQREAKNWTIYQEVADVRVPGSEGTYPLDKSPWIALRFTKIDGEDYGRGYIEEYLGDLRSLEALTQAIVEGSAAAAKILFLVNPNGVTQQKTLSEAPNGAVRAGNAADVSVVQAEKFADFRTALETVDKIEKRLSFAFLLNSSVQRGGERVTAEEIRFMANELESALGGVYSILSLELQLPLVKALMHRLEKQNRIPTLPKGTVRPTITTGLEGLGRGNDLNKLDMLLQGAIGTLGPELIHQRLNVSDYMTRRATALGIDAKGLILTEEEVQAKAEQEARAAMSQAATTQGIQTAGNVIEGTLTQ